MCKPVWHVSKLYTITRFKDARGDLRREILIDNLFKKLKRKMRAKDKKMAKNFEAMNDVPLESLDSEDNLELNGFFEDLKAVNNSEPKQT